MLSRAFTGCSLLCPYCKTVAKLLKNREKEKVFLLFLRNKIDFILFCP